MTTSSVRRRPGLRPVLRPVLRPGLRLVLPVVLAVTALLGPSAAVPARATVAPGVAAEPGAPSVPVVRRVGKCRLYANNGGFGALCGSGARRQGLTWRERLGGRPFVACRQDDVPSGVSTPPPPDDGPGRWFLETCMVDVDQDTRDGGDADTRIRLAWVPAGRELGPVPPWMDWLWDAFANDYPTPVLSVGPTARPRVNVPAYFWLEGESAQTQTRQVFDGRRTITMQARLARLRVDPGTDPGPGGLGAPALPVDCPDGGTAYDRSVGPFDQASTCSHTFARSSAWLPDRAYPVRADADWEVGWIEGGTFRLLGTFTVGSVQLLPVQEVESVVRVSGD